MGRRYGKGFARSRQAAARRHHPLPGVLPRARQRASIRARNRQRLRGICSALAWIQTAFPYLFHASHSRQADFVPASDSGAAFPPIRLDKSCLSNHMIDCFMYRICAYHATY